MASVAVIVGSSQGIGLQLARIYLSQTDLHVVALSRNSEKARSAILDASSPLPFLAVRDKEANYPSGDAFKAVSEKGALDERRLLTIDTDVNEEDSIAKASESVKSSFGKDSVRLLLNVAGMLHPEKNLSQVQYDEMLAQFRLNTFAPLLTLKHFMPLLHTQQTLSKLGDKSKGILSPDLNTIASLSARVGSISDNKLGGWYSYRASKAAQNQITRSVSVELARKKSPTVCVGLHPGTVRTDLSKAFTGGPGGGAKEDDDEKEIGKERRSKGEFEARESASLLAGVLSRLKTEDSGYVWDYAGTKVPY